MNVLHISRYHWAYSIGGVETYLKDLIRYQKDEQIESAILTFRHKSEEGISFPEGFKTYIIPYLTDITEEELKAIIIETFQSDPFDLVHFHSFNAEESVIADILSDHKIKYIFTYHLPGSSCNRGDLLRWGHQVCDGEVKALKCTACLIQNRLKTRPYISSILAIMLGLFSFFLSFLSESHFKWGINYWSRTLNFGKRLNRFLNGCTFIITCAGWSHNVLINNCTDKSKVIYCPQGIPSEFVSQCNLYDKQRVKTRGRFCIGYVGRIHEVKGVDILIKAFLKIDAVQARLVIYGDSDKFATSDYERKIMRLIEHDSRIQIYFNTPHEKLKDIYRSFNVLAVPSIWPETGPLVVWEALSCGVPVMASNKIGHPDLLKDQKNGYLVDPNSIAKWVEVLDQVIKGKIRLPEIENDSLRTMKDVGKEMVKIYRSACNNHVTEI